jgi:hypothetical protein
MPDLDGHLMTEHCNTLQAWLRVGGIPGGRSTGHTVRTKGRQAAGVVRRSGGHKGMRSRGRGNVYLYGDILMLAPRLSLLSSHIPAYLRLRLDVNTALTQVYHTQNATRNNLLNMLHCIPTFTRPMARSPLGLLTMGLSLFTSVTAFKPAPFGTSYSNVTTPLPITTGQRHLKVDFFGYTAWADFEIGIDKGKVVSCLYESLH